MSIALAQKVKELERRIEELERRASQPPPPQVTARVIPNRPGTMDDDIPEPGAVPRGVLGKRSR